jgi:hypothetical protein
MTKEEYHKYLKSKDWLLKKNELISTYLKQGWDIKCKTCGSTDNLNVHHENYDNIGNEILTDERIWDLSFMCYECHQRWHFEKGFKEGYEAWSMQEFLEMIRRNALIRDFNNIKQNERALQP